MVDTLRSRIEATGAQLVFALPRPVRRLIAGRAIRIDGQVLSLDAQLLLRLQQFAGVTMSKDTPELAREMLARSSIWSAARRSARSPSRS